ncbi:hypothetical protein NKDENANG_00428 [Candidatus Entotheonellaceae bacterium PAL068K]
MSHFGIEPIREPARVNCVLMLYGFNTFGAISTLHTYTRHLGGGPMYPCHIVPYRPAARFIVLIIMPERTRPILSLILLLVG